MSKRKVSLKKSREKKKLTKARRDSTGSFHSAGTRAFHMGYACDDLRIVCFDCFFAQFRIFLRIATAIM